MQILKIWNDKIASNQLDVAEEELKRGSVIIYPTDTLYAVGCDALNAKAVEEMCRLKHINPQKQMLSIICADISMSAKYARIDNRAFEMLKKYTPGAYTFILPASNTLPRQFKGRKTVGVRIPDNDVPRFLAERLGNPLLTASVAIDEDDIDMVRQPELIAQEYEGKVGLMIDGGEGETEGSTVVDLTSDEIVVVRDGKGVL